MAMNQVVLYFDKPQDALLFTVAASAVMSPEGPMHSSKAATRVAKEICKVSRITTDECSERQLRAEKNMIRKATLQVVAPALLALIAWNAYTAVSHLTTSAEDFRRSHSKARLSKPNLSEVLKDITDMETAQRGFLLTGNATYLQPYADAKARIGADFVEPSCRALESDAERTITGIPLGISGYIKAGRDGTLYQFAAARVSPSLIQARRYQRRQGLHG